MTCRATFILPARRVHRAHPNHHETSAVQALDGGGASAAQRSGWTGTEQRGHSWGANEQGAMRRRTPSRSGGLEPSCRLSAGAWPRQCLFAQRTPLCPLRRHTWRTGAPNGLAWCELGLPHLAPAVVCSTELQYSTVRLQRIVKCFCARLRKRWCTVQ